MDRFYSPILLVCDAVKDTCVTVVNPSLTGLVTLEECTAMWGEQILIMAQSNPTLQVIGKCIAWGISA